MARVRLAVLSLLVAALAGCGTTTSATGGGGNAKDAIAAAKGSIVMANARDAARAKGAVKLRCADIAAPKKGAVYLCTAAVRRSGPASVVVTQTDESGNVRVRVTQRMITTRRIVGQIKKLVRKQIKKTPRVACPRKVRSMVGGRFSCRVTANGKAIRIVATQKDTRGNFTLRVR